MPRPLLPAMMPPSVDCAALLTASPAGVFILTTQGVCLFANLACSRLLGIPHEQLLDAVVLELIHPEDRSRVQEAFRQAVSAGGGCALEFRFRRGDGSVVWAAGQFQPWRDGGGALLGYAGTMSDITARKEAEAVLARLNAELLEAARQKDAFLANMSHELRTPLTAILGLADGMRQEASGPVSDGQREMLDGIVESGRHLLAVIGDILDIAKIAAGRFELHAIPVDVAECCGASLVMLREAARRKRQTLTLDLDPAVVFLEADERRLVQMLVNLLGNAVKFTPEEGRISLEVRGDAARRVAAFHVRDTGPGMTPAQQARLFQPFTQVGDAVQRGQGAGLGLALVRHMAELHAGSVRVESAPGQGSCFTITLPWVAASTDATEAGSVD